MAASSYHGPEEAVAEKERNLYGKGATTETVVVVLGEEAREIDPQIAKRVLRKIDLFLMPAMVMCKNAFCDYSTTLSADDYLQYMGSWFMTKYHNRTTIRRIII